MSRGCKDLKYYWAPKYAADFYILQDRHLASLIFVSIFLRFETINLRKEIEFLKVSE